MSGSSPRRVSQGRNGYPPGMEISARLVSMAHELIPIAQACAFAIAEVGSPIKVLDSSDALASAVIEAHLSVSGGPALDLLGRHGVEVVSDTRVDPRWPTLCSRLVELGVRSIAASDVPVTHRSRGIVVVCSAAPHAFGADAQSMLTVLAHRAGSALRLRENAENLQQAIRGQQTIGQAVGILMERHRIDSDAAFARLVDASHHTHGTLPVVAGRLVNAAHAPDGVGAQTLVGSPYS